MRGHYNISERPGVLEAAYPMKSLAMTMEVDVLSKMMSEQ